MTNSITKQTQEPALAGQRGGVLLGFAIWTGLVILALWWIWSGGGEIKGGGWVVQAGPETSNLGERVRDWFRLVHLNFKRVYPWLLFGPYVAWLASRLTWERGRARITIAAHVAGCLAFGAACYLVDSRLSTSSAKVVIVTSQKDLGDTTTRSTQAARTLRFEVTRTSAGAIPQEGEFFSTGLVSRLPPSPELGARELTDLLPTNVVTEMAAAMRPTGLGAGALSLRPLSIFLDTLAYATLAGIAQAVHFYRRFRERERRALMLESHLAQARLSALQAQLQPHFLFNTLNAIATLLRRDTRAAETTLTSLSDLLRITLSRSDQQEIPLREELEFLTRYVEIQQTRFADRLRFELAAEPETLACLVPTLGLQSLVENAIRHGIEPSGRPGVVRVRAKRAGARLELAVEDDGVGLPAGQVNGSQDGIGLTNLRARLETLYGGAYQLRLTSRAGGGVTVQMETPWRPVTAVEAGRKGA